MGLFGRPSQQLIQSFRDQLKITVERIPPISAAIAFRCSPVTSGQYEVVSVRYKPDKLPFITQGSGISAQVQPLGGSDGGSTENNPSTPRAQQLEGGRFSDLHVRADVTSGTGSSVGFGADVASADLQPIASMNGISTKFDDPISKRTDLVVTLRPARRARLINSEDARIVAATDVPNIRHIVREVELLTSAQLRAQAIDPTIRKVKATAFNFRPIREERTGSLFAECLPISSSRLARVAPVPRPEPPPELKQASLEDRLRWLLTPPIHEILSDPQLALPEKPFPYQMQGIKWLYDRENCLLADEMGLGKTMQAILAARLLWKDGKIKHTLVVCPKSLIANWQNELRTWWPAVVPYLWVVKSDREWALRQSTSNVAVKIINYESLPSELEWLKEKPPTHDLVIIDEAQRIKNPKSKTAQAVKTLKSRRRWALTGTPLENSTEDLVSIFGFVKPGLIHSESGTHKIRTRVKPYILRRRQEEVLKDLPEKIEQDVEVELSGAQRHTYDAAEHEGVVRLNEKGDSITVTHVFALINSLRQICNFDPATGESGKVELLLEELEEILENDRKALIFGHFVDDRFGLKRLSKTLGDAVSPRPSPLQLHGEIPERQRNGIVESFQRDPNYQLLMLNYRVGGVGLNLQAATYVFLFDRWWNPAIEDQAVKRCHRIGQKHSVIVKRFYCKETIEERILLKLAEKRRLFSHMIDENRPAEAMGLTDEEVFSLFKELTVRPRRMGAQTAPSQIVLDDIDDKYFESLVAEIYAKDGYDVKVTGRSHDGGIDILAERTAGAGRERVIVQCKHQRQSVGRPVVQQLWGAASSDPSVTRCDLVTSASVSAEARGFAAGKRLTLVDRTKLIELAKARGVRLT
jgi:superfamily II DNA or RNA helicase